MGNHCGSLCNSGIDLWPQLAAHDFADDCHRVCALVDDTVNALDDRRLDAQLLREIVS